MPSFPRKLLSYAVLIEAGSTHGSGFFMGHEMATYLVTARHVLFKEGLELYPSVRLTAIDNTSLVRKVHYDIDCSILFGDGNLQKHPSADVAIVKIADYSPDEENPIRSRLHLGRGVVEVGAHPENVLGGTSSADIFMLDSVGLGSSVVLLGYPTSLAGDFFAKGTPLLRGGLVAGFTDKQIIVDCPVYFGNSGAMVAEETDEGLVVIGVASRMIPFQERLYSLDFRREVGIRYENSGYALVEPMDRVLELLTGSLGADR